MSLTDTRADVTFRSSSRPLEDRPRRPRRRRTAPEGSRAETIAAWTFLAPFLIIFAAFTLIPAVFAVGASLTDMTSRDIRTPLYVDFVGLDSYGAAVSDPTFRGAFLNTLVFVALCVPFSMALGLALALLLNHGVRRLRATFRAAAYIPVVTNIVAAAIIWQYAFSVSGPVNGLLGSLGTTGPNWLAEPNSAVGVVVLVGVWRSAGTCMILFLAGLQAVPEELYEAAAVDGAGWIRRLWSITLPLLRPTTLVISVLMTVSFLNIFEEPYLLTGGGPLGSTRSVAIWVYEQFGYGNIAASMAGSVMLLVLVGLVAIIQFRMLRPKH